MNTRDLRVIKTQRAIHDAFLSLLRTKPLAKISVTELARIAEINKGTFYLHYRDIYDLYHALLLYRPDHYARHGKLLCDHRPFQLGLLHQRGKQPCPRRSEERR